MLVWVWIGKGSGHAQTNEMPGVALVTTFTHSQLKIISRKVSTLRQSEVTAGYDDTICGSHLGAVAVGVQVQG